MIIGSGLLARAFYDEFSCREDVCIYAAGVSNSSCADAHEFARERELLSASLEQSKSSCTFVYFGTCSVMDSEMEASPYVQHKLAMEKLVLAYPDNLVLRLPQIAGRTANPHTLLNFLYERISRGESFQLWTKAKRNIIDVEDVVRIVAHLVKEDTVRNTILNVANIVNYSMFEIVEVMESVVGKRAIYEIVERGGEYLIDTTFIDAIFKDRQISASQEYLARTIKKYYLNY